MGDGKEIGIKPIPDGSFANSLTPHTDYIIKPDELVGGATIRYVDEIEAIKELRKRFHYFDILVLSANSPKRFEEVKSIFKNQFARGEGTMSDYELDTHVENIIRRAMPEVVRNHIAMTFESMEKKDIESMTEILTEDNDDKFLDYLQEVTLAYLGGKLTKEDLQPFISFAKSEAQKNLDRLLDIDAENKLGKFKKQVERFLTYYIHKLSIEEVEVLYNKIDAGLFNPELDSNSTPFDFHIGDFYQNRAEVLKILDELKEKKIKKLQDADYKKADPERTELLEEIRYTLSEQITTEEVNDLLKNASIENLIQFFKDQKAKDLIFDANISNEQVEKYYDDIMAWFEKWKREKEESK